MGDYSFEDAEPFSILETSFALPTACLSFDADAKTYGPATSSAASSASGSGSATAKGHSGGKSGAGAVVNPFGGREFGLRGVVVVSGLVLVGGVCFVLL